MKKIWSNNITTTTKYWKDQSVRLNLDYSNSIIAHHAKSFYFSSRFLPKEIRWATYAVYSYCRHIDNIVDKPRNRSKSEILWELDTIRKELDYAYIYGESEHPVISSFIHVAKAYGIPSIYPHELIDGVLMDIDTVRYESFNELYVFCYRVASVVGLMMTHVLGYSDKSAFIYAEALGIGMQLTNILRDIREDKNMGRIYLPLEELDDFGLSENIIMNEQFDDRFKEFMIFQINRAREYYSISEPGIELLHHESRFAITASSRIYSGILSKIEKIGYNPFQERVYVSKSQKIAILGKEIVRNKFLQLLERINLL